MRVPRRRAGALELPVLSLGSWHTWDRMEHDAAVALIRFAVDSGVDLFDVAHYDFGPRAEGSDTDVRFGRIVEAAGLARSDFMLCGKLWLWNYPEQPLEAQLRRSLERIGTDHAELVILGDFAGRLDIPRAVGDVAELVRAGLVGHWGVNNWAADDVAAAHAFAVREGMPPPALAQLKYSVARRSIPEGAPYRRLCDELGLALQASDVLEGGILAGKVAPARRIGSDPGGIREAIRAAAPRLAAVAAELGATPAQLAVAFCLTHPAVASVLVGVSRIEQLTDDLGAIELARHHGDVLRARLADLWLDRGVVEPDASWGATRAAALAAGAR